MKCSYQPCDGEVKHVLTLKPSKNWEEVASTIFTLCVNCFEKDCQESSREYLETYYEIADV